MEYTEYIIKFSCSCFNQSLNVLNVFSNLMHLE